jgi:restriction system protein
VLNALRAKGGEATNSEIREAVATELNLTADDLAALHKPGKGTRTEVEYRLAWARTRLKNEGVIERARPQVWRLTSPTSPTEP